MKKWKDGKMLFNKWKDELVPLPEAYLKKQMFNSLEEDEEDFNDDETLQTYDQWLEDDLEDFTRHFITESGDKIVVFGKYGYDG